MDAAVAHNVSQIVFTSVNRRKPPGLPPPSRDPRADRQHCLPPDGDVPTEVPHFKSKHNIEEYLIKQAGDKVKWT